LSGEMHASIKGQMLDDSRFARSAVLDRLRDAFCSVEAVTGANKRITGQTTQVPGGACEVNPDRITAWGSAFGAWGRIDGNGDAAALNRSIGGFVVGADARIVDTWRVGLMAGYDRSSFTARDRSSSGSSDDYHLGLYGGTRWGQLALRLG
ncbi:autotransporter outer membrane beta-barrel domain-containing protein, partial [Lactobacillus crispatus]|uniref:autotransporter outer membrane beta-barrel domain-containing protein n=1 Tax=Lactobacillus crispatus TaxID=47770 RepID=UPI00105C294B